MTHPYDQHVAQQVKLNKRKSRLMIFVFVAIFSDETSTPVNIVAQSQGPKN
jgi:hypothetical protein